MKKIARAAQGIALGLTLVAACAPCWAQAPAAIDPEWGDKLAVLAKNGFMGVAIALFLFAAAVLVWGKRETEQEAKAFRAYLMYAFLSLVLAAGIEIWKTRNSGTVVVWFSPKFHKDVPQPEIRNAAGYIGKQGDPIDISSDRTVQIVLDDAIEKIESLASANQAQQRVVFKLASQNPLTEAEGQ